MWPGDGSWGEDGGLDREEVIYGVDVEGVRGPSHRSTLLRGRPAVCLVLERQAGNSGKDQRSFWKTLYFLATNISELMSLIFLSLSLLTDTFRPIGGANQEGPRWENRWLYARVICQIYWRLCGLIRDKLTFVFRPSDPHSTLKRISSKAKAAIHLEGESQRTLIWCSANTGLMLRLSKGPFRLVLPPVWYLPLVLVRRSIRKLLHELFISFRQSFISLSKLHTC